MHIFTPRPLVVRDTPKSTTTNDFFSGFLKLRKSVPRTKPRKEGIEIKLTCPIADLRGRQVRDSVIDEVTAWQGRPLDPTYTFVFFDALRVMNELKTRGLNLHRAFDSLHHAIRIMEGTESGGCGVKTDLSRRVCGDGCACARPV
jgi:hypothetical protein